MTGDLVIRTGLRSAASWLSGVSDSARRGSGREHHGIQSRRQNGKPELSPAWRSVNMMAPDPAVIANGVVYALATGDATRQVASGGGILSSKERLAETKPAVLHAFDAQTGKELFSSGSTLKSFAHFSGLAVAEGRVFATTFDGKLHCFGLGDRGQ